MKSKHTPGPWTANENGSIEYEGGYLGEAYAYCENSYEDLPMMANARLMAAAPEMFECLDAIMGFDSKANYRARRRAYDLLKELKKP